MCVLAMPLLCLIQSTLLAQDSTKAAQLRTQQPDNRKDSTKLLIKTDSTAPIITEPVHSPRKAAFYSAVLPGLGQAYNHNYWKIPLIYATLGITTATYIINSKEYRRFRNAYRIRMDGNDDTVDEFANLYRNASSLKTIRDAYREYMDYSVLVFALGYALNIIDATVFAHLLTYDMSNDLSMKIVPTVIDNRAIGVNLKISLGGKKKYPGGLAIQR